MAGITRKTGQTGAGGGACIPDDWQKMIKIWGKQIAAASADVMAVVGAAGHLSFPFGARLILGRLCR